MTETEHDSIPSISLEEYENKLANGKYGSIEITNFCAAKGIPLDQESVEIMVGGKLIRIDTREEDFGTMDADTDLPDEE